MFFLCQMLVCYALTVEGAREALQEGDIYSCKSVSNYYSPLLQLLILLSKRPLFKLHVISVSCLDPVLKKTS